MKECPLYHLFTLRWNYGRNSHLKVNNNERMTSLFTLSWNYERKSHLKVNNNERMTSLFTLKWNHGWNSHLKVKEWFNCIMRMPGTVKCRPTVAYWVQIDGINIPTELITRYHSNKTLIQCCINVRPTSATLAQHWTNIGQMYNVWEKVLLPSKHKTFVWHLYNVCPTSSTLVQHCMKSYKCFVFTVRQFPHTRSITVSLFASQRPSRGKVQGLWILNSLMSLKYIWTCCYLRTCS